ncbi:hypothetical protein V9L05_15160 [Bernardetia sp. Wsw4-3y2]|uniref:hypothetical protein n=1 Tax=Bernardetia sp. Wsw4-3y2 TaxID=3127471 RepID=UPI0030CEACAD
MQIINKILLAVGYIHAFLWIISYSYYHLEQIAMKITAPKNVKYKRISFRQWLAYVIVPKKRIKKSTPKPKLKGGKK